MCEGSERRIVARWRTVGRVGGWACAGSFEVDWFCGGVDGRCGSGLVIWPGSGVET